MSHALEVRATEDKQKAAVDVKKWIKERQRAMGKESMASNTRQVGVECILQRSNTAECQRNVQHEYMKQSAPNNSLPRTRLQDLVD